jgi:hypothetical protein
MTFTILTIVLFALFAAYAHSSGNDDAWKADHDKHIDHGEQLAWRMFFGAILILAYWFFVEPFAAWWLFIPASTAMWAWWTMIFRLTMNLSRRRPKRDWRYVSPSNWYDRVWLHIAGQRGNMSILYPKRIRRAGTIAYIFEAFVLAASVVGLIAAIQ